MILHLGERQVIWKKDIVGIFDLDRVTVEKNSREYLRKAEQRGEVVSCIAKLPKSFVLTRRAGKNQIYLCSAAVSTLRGRIQKTEKNKGVVEIES